LITTYVSLSISRFSELCKLARNLTNVFGGIQTCEQVLYAYETKQIEILFKIHRCALTWCDATGISGLETNVNSLKEQRHI